MKKKLLVSLLIVASVFGYSITSYAIDKNKPSIQVEKFVSIEEETTTKELTLEDTIRNQTIFFENMEGGVYERISNATNFLPEDIRSVYCIGDISFTNSVKEGFVIRSQTINEDGISIVDLGIVKECENPEYYVLQTIAAFAAHRTDIVPYEKESYLYAWEQEHKVDFFEDEPISNPIRDYEKYFASICLKDPAYEYNKKMAPLTTSFIEDYIENFNLYCNINAERHTCKHEDRKHYSLDMRLNWVKAELPEEVRVAMEEHELEFVFIDRSQELVDLVGLEFMGLYCPVGSLSNTSYGTIERPTILLVNGYEDYFEETVRHEIGHFVCDYTSYPVWNELGNYLSQNEEKVNYFNSTGYYVPASTGEYFADAFAYYYCDKCNVSKYWNAYSPELNSIVEQSVKNLNSTERGEFYERD